MLHNGRVHGAGHVTGQHLEKSVPAFFTCIGYSDPLPGNCDWGNVVLSAEGWLLGMRGFNKHGALLTSLASVVGGVLFRGMVHE